MTITYDIVVSIRDAETGLEVFGAPLTYTVEADETSGPARYNEPDIGDAVSFAPVVPSELFDSLQLVVITASKETTWRFNGQTDSGITIAANGIILLAGATIDDGAGTHVMVNNDSGATAAVRILAVGSDD